MKQHKINLLSFIYISILDHLNSVFCKNIDILILTCAFDVIVTAITLIALADIFEAREDKLTEVDMEGNAAMGLCSLSGVV